MKLSKLFFVALVSGTVAVLGCGDDGGSGGSGGTGGMGGGAGSGGGGDVRAGLYQGIMGDPFNTDNGWAVCFYVAPNLTELMVAQPCNVDNIFDGDNDADAYAFDIDVEVQASNCDFDISYRVDTVPINDGVFEVTGWMPGGQLTDLNFRGVINGTSASGTASNDAINCSTTWTAEFVQ